MDLLMKVPLVRLWITQFIPNFLYLLFSAAIIVSAELFDWGSGIYAVPLSAACAACFLIPPINDFVIQGFTQVAGLVLLFVIGLVTAGIIEARDSHLHQGRPYGPHAARGVEYRVRAVRGRIEKVFGTWKRSYGLRRMRWVENAAVSKRWAPEGQPPAAVAIPSDRRIDRSAWTDRCDNVKSSGY